MDKIFRQEHCHLFSMKLLPKIAIILVVCIALVSAFALILGLLSPAARWNFGLWLGQRDYNYITGLRDKLQKEPTNSVVLNKIIARTKVQSSLSRVNALAVLTQLSFYNTPTGKQIHDQALPIFVSALNDEDLAFKRVGFEGLENLGPYAVSAIPEIKKKLNDSAPTIQQEAQKALDELQKFQTNSNSVLK